MDNKLTVTIEETKNGFGLVDNGGNIMEPEFSTLEEAERMADIYWPGCRNGNSWIITI